MAKTEFHLYSGYRLVTKDPAKLSMLSTDMQKKFIEGMRNTVNIMAFSTRKKARHNIEQRMTIRRPWVSKQLHADKAPANPQRLEDCVAEIGAYKKANFLERQEKGGTRKYKKNPSNLNIPTEIEKPALVDKKPTTIKKEIKKSLYRQSLYKPKRKYTSKKAEFVAKLFAMQKNGGDEKNPPIFVSGNGNIDKENWMLYKSHEMLGEKLRLDAKRIFTNTFAEAEVKPISWLKDAVDDTLSKRDAIFKSQMKKLENK